MLFREELGRRHERDLQAVLQRDEGGQQGHDGLAAAHVALQEPVHRMGATQVVDDGAQRPPLAGGQPEGQHGEGRTADAVVDPHRVRLALPGPGPAPDLEAEPEQEQFFQDQPHLGGAAELVQPRERGVRGREMRFPERLPAIRQAQAGAEARRQGIVEVGRQLFQRPVHQPPKLLRRQGSDALVHRDHAGAVQPPPGLSTVAPLLPAVEQLVLRVAQPQPAGLAPFGGAVEQDRLPRREHRLQVRLVHPDRPERAGFVAQQHLEQREAAAARMPQAGADHLPADGGGLASPQFAGAHEAAAVLVTEGEPVKKVVGRAQARPFEFRRPAGSDTLQETQLGVQR